MRTHRQSCCLCHYLPSSPLETKVSGAGWPDPHSKKEMFNVRTLGPFFLEKESRVPSPLLVFHPEFAQKKAGARHGHPGFRQDPCSWSSLALPLPPSPPSWTPQCQHAFLGMGPVSPWSRQPSTYHQKEATKGPNSYCLIPGLLELQPQRPTCPVCELDGPRADPPSRWKPGSLSIVPSCELLLCIVVTNTRSIC